MNVYKYKKVFNLDLQLKLWILYKILVAII